MKFKWIENVTGSDAQCVFAHKLNVCVHIWKSFSGIFCAALPNSLIHNSNSSPFWPNVRVRYGEQTEIENGLRISLTIFGSIPRTGNLATRIDGGLVCGGALWGTTLSNKFKRSFMRRMGFYLCASITINTISFAHFVPCLRRYNCNTDNLFFRIYYCFIKKAPKTWTQSLASLRDSVCARWRGQSQGTDTGIALARSWRIWGYYCRWSF